MIKTATGAAYSSADSKKPQYLVNKPIPNADIITAGKLPKPAAVTIAKEPIEYVIP